MLASLLQNAPQVKMLVTSRERLNIHGEAVVELRGINYPKSEAMDKLESYAAIQLFVQSARNVQPDFRMTEENRLYVAAICQVLEGLPLGIELASSWVRILSCKEILEEIESNMDFLTSTMQDLPERHRSLRAVFEHSWNLLTLEEQQVLSSLSALRGSFTRQAASEIAQASLANLISLLDKSLLYKASEGRYMMHEVLHEYAREKLILDELLCRRALKSQCFYYTNLLQSLEPHLADRRQKEFLDEINTDIENIRAAWQFACANRSVEALDRALHSLYFFYDLRGLILEGERAFLSAQSSLETDGKDQHPLTYARVLVRRGVFLTRLAQYEEATRLFERSLPLLKAQNNPAEEAFAYLMYRLTANPNRALRSCPQNVESQPGAAPHDRSPTGYRADLERARLD